MGTSYLIWVITKIRLIAKINAEMQDERALAFFLGGGVFFVQRCQYKSKITAVLNFGAAPILHALMNEGGRASRQVDLVL